MSYIRNFSLSAIFALAILATPIKNALAEDPVIEEKILTVKVEVLLTKKSKFDVRDTASRFVRAIEKKGMIIFSRIDHGELAKDAKMQLEDTELIIFGNMATNTTLMQENRRIGIDLPLRALVWEDGADTYISVTNPFALKTRYDIFGNAELFHNMKDALEDAIGYATGYGN